MPHEQVTSRFQTRRETCDQLRLGLMTEIDHHVSAEDQVESAYVGKRLDKVDSTKVDHIHDFRSHSVPTIPMAFAAQKMLPEPGSEYTLEPRRGICALPSCFKGVCGDVGAE